MNKGAKKTLIKLIVAVPLMFAFGFALVPLYDVFCEAVSYTHLTLPTIRSV